MRRTTPPQPSRGGSGAGPEDEKSHHRIRAAVAEPEVLKIIGAESRRNGMDRLTLRKIKTTRAEPAKRHFRNTADKK